jgi:hypothetical protein
MTFDTPDDVLEHFGVKGMRWGVRRQRSSDSKVSGGKQKTSKKKRAAQIAIVGGVVVAGAILAHRGGVRMSSLSRAPQTLPQMSTSGSSSIAKSALQRQSILSRVGKTRVSSIPRVGDVVPNPLRTTTPRVGSSVPNPLRTTTPRVGSSLRNPTAVRDLRSSIAASVRAANVQLRARDNDLNIPIHQRSYLTEWD